MHSLHWQQAAGHLDAVRMHAALVCLQLLMPTVNECGACDWPRPDGAIVQSSQPQSCHASQQEDPAIPHALQNGVLALQLAALLDNCLALHFWGLYSFWCRPAGTYNEAVNTTEQKVES